ncbi:chaperone protein DnaK [Achaetomium macrosporum]|uniref:Chaperone protein DnaK n=1 Tax=Achaetomium macrosporum TaxID=79813 RepID=A0AAN7CAB8_9PEZI|nr:chaperone protein DnaK [Achaetomium macrosporum]
MTDPEKVEITDRKIIVGIDFGTTYSAVAWAETQRPDRRVAITVWPTSKMNLKGESSDKVPTKLRYKGTDAQWGFAIPVSAPADEVVEWFKLDLDPSLQCMGTAVTFAASSGVRDVDTLVTDYISALGDHLMYTLREKLGEGVVTSTPLEFVVTVPAIWSDLAKDKMRQACQRATALSAPNAPIDLVSEPEAAAIYALHGFDQHGLDVGDSFVVCDAGGGTVDLISYTVTNLKPILSVREAAPGTGSLCGSAFLNMRFAKFLKAKLGNIEGFDDEVLADAMERFDKTVCPFFPLHDMRQFTLKDRDDDTYTIPVGGLAKDKALGINRGRYALKVSDLRVIFEPVVQEVIKLVKDQITSSRVSIKAVLLVGGFGASIYLKERLRAAIDSKIHIMQPPNPWLAIVQGAVMKGLAQSAPENLTLVSVQARKARKHYGIECKKPYDEEVHGGLGPNCTKEWCGMDGCWKVKNMVWFIQRGDAVSENEPFYTYIIWNFPVTLGRPGKLWLNVYADPTAREAPIERDENVALLCHIEVDFGHIPENLLGRKKGVDGQWYYQLRCTVEAVYLSASTRYTLLYNGERYSSVTAEYV